MLWEIWVLSKTYTKTPAELLFIKDEVHCYFINRAVAAFGLSVDAELQEVANKAKTDGEIRRKSKMVLARWLRDPEEAIKADGGSKFRDPAIMK